MKGEEEMRAKECAGEMDKERDKMKSCDKGDVRCEEEGGGDKMYLRN